MLYQLLSRQFTTKTSTYTYIAMLKIIVALLAIFALVAAKKPTIYSVSTGFTGALTESYSYISQIDINTGANSQLLETFVYAGNSLTYDGISTFDSDKGVYYYATDGNSDFVFRANVLTSTLMSPIAFPLDIVNELKYDSLNKRLLVNGCLKDKCYLISFPTDASKAWSYVSSFKDTDGFFHGTIDSANQIYYYISAQQINNTFAYLFINTLNLNTGALKTAQMNCNRMVFPDILVWDSSKKQLLAFGVEIVKQGSNTMLYYHVDQISTTGGCKQIEINFPTTGITTGWAYDEQTGTAYTAMTNGNTNILYGVNTEVGSVVSTTNLGPNLEPSSIEFAYV